MLIAYIISLKIKLDLNKLFGGKNKAVFCLKIRTIIDFRK